MAKEKSTGSGQSTQRSRMARRSRSLVETIRAMIVSFELPPGSVVSESDLTKRLGAGRTPVREALLVLSQEYLVKQVPGMGSTVAGLDVTDWAAIEEFQEGLEPFAARLAAMRITDAELEQLEAIVNAARPLAEAGDFDRVAQLNLEFHEALLGATRNQYLFDAAMRLNRYAVRFWRFAYSRGVPMVPSINDHQRIIEALREHDPDEAEKVSHVHWSSASGWFGGGPRPANGDDSATRSL